MIHESRAKAVDYISRNITMVCGCGKKGTWSCKKGRGMDHAHELVTNREYPISAFVLRDKTQPSCPLPRKIEGKWTTIDLYTFHREPYSEAQILPLA